MVTRHRRTNFRERKKIDWEAVIWSTICAVLVVSVMWTSDSRAADAHVVLDVMRCESGFRHDAVGDDGVSRGIAQFRKETFYEFAAMAKKQGKWKFGKPRWLDPQQQVFLLEWGIDNGYGRRWTCFRKLGEGGVK